MKRIISVLLAAAMLTCALSFTTSAELAPIGSAVDGVISGGFQSQPSGDVSYDMLFRDSWFNASAFTYNHELATASLRAAMSGFRTGTGGTALIRPFFQNIGCPDSTVYIRNFEVTDCYDDVAAFAFGLKSLPGTDTYLLPVVIRGGNYQGEWASNVRVYDKDYPDVAAGFYKAAEYVVDYLNEYIDGLDIPRSKLKLWITGYSRGAAVANDVAKIMTDDGRTPAANIFGYSFATPETVLEQAKGSYRNLFSICSELDLVMRLPLLEWDYTHFGTSLYLPCRSTRGAAYDGLLAGMQKEFDHIMAQIGAPDVHNTPLDEQEKAVDLLASFLTSAIATPKEYGTEGWQDLFVDLLTHIEGDGDIAAAFIDSLVPDARVAQSLYDFLAGVTERTDEENVKLLGSLLSQINVRKSLSASARDRELLAMLYEILSDYRTCLKAERITNGQSASTKYYTLLIEEIAAIITDEIYSPLLMQHWPEAYLAWMQSSVDGSDLFATEHHKITSIKKPILTGDVNDDNDVTAADLTLLNRYLLLPKKTAINTAAADIDGNGKINLIDATKFLALLVLCK